MIYHDLRRRHITSKTVSPVTPGMIQTPQVAASHVTPATVALSTPALRGRRVTSLTANTLMPSTSACHASQLV